MKNNFDRAMDYIDANIEKCIDEILKGFIDNFSFTSPCLPTAICLRPILGTTPAVNEFIKAADSRRFIVTAIN